MIDFEKINKICNGNAQAYKRLHESDGIKKIKGITILWDAF
jgi:hypothetical protein